MSRGNVISSRIHCNGCGRISQFERNGNVWGGGDFIMVFLSCGLWVGLKVLFNRVRNPWRCATCGASTPALSTPVAVLAGGGSLLAAILLFGTVGRACLGSDSRSGANSFRPTPAASSESAARPPADTTFDLIDMLPEEAGGMELARAEAWRGRGEYHIPVPEQEAIGHYIWADGDRHANAFDQIIWEDAKVTCRRTPDTEEPLCDREATKVKVAGVPGCYYPEEGRNCVLKIKGVSTKARGALVDWVGCSLEYPCGHVEKRSKQAILAVAEAIQKWASQIREGGATVTELQKNRSALSKAVDNQRRSKK
jgi:hypothetical protein